MAHVIKDRVAESWTGTGTGTVTASGTALGASYRTLTSVLAASDTFPYLIVHQTAAEWETGTGTWNGTGFTRSVKQSSNSNAAVDFSSGTKEIRLAPSSSDVKPIGDVDVATAPALDDSLLGWDTSGDAAALYPIQDLTKGIGLKLHSLAAEPAAPSGGVLVYSKSIAGRHMPKIVGPSGIDTVMQVGLHGNSVFMVAPASGTTAPTAWGGTLTTAATMSLQQTIASANPWLATARKRFQTSTTAGNATGMRTAYTQWFRGSAAGFGGFFFRAQIGANINLNGGQKFCGLCASTGALAGEPSALTNMIGMGWDAADASSGNWFFMRNDGSGTATKVDLGSTNAARSNTTHGYDLVMFCPPGAATEIWVRIVNLHNGNTVLDTSYTTDLPATNAGMAFKCEVRNGATTSNDNIECAKVYIESDY